MRFTTLDAAARYATAGPGVYAIGTVTRLKGLPLSSQWTYIGMGKNLRARIAQHLPNTEANKALRAWIQSHYATVEIWATAAADVQAADSLESELIGALNPIFNTRKRTDLNSGKMND